MKKEINEVIKICKTNGNKNLLWLSSNLENHYDGIISHTAYKLSSGKIEGINNKIKILRR